MKRLRGVFKKANSKTDAVGEGAAKPDSSVPTKAGLDVDGGDTDGKSLTAIGADNSSEVNGSANSGSGSEHMESEEPERSTTDARRGRRGTEDVVASLLATKKLDIRASQKVGPRPQSLALEQASALVREHRSSKGVLAGSADAALESLVGGSLRPTSLRAKPARQTAEGFPEERLTESYNRLSQRLRTITGSGGLGDFLTKPLPSNRSQAPTDAGGVKSSVPKGTPISRDGHTRAKHDPALAKVAYSVSATLGDLYANTRPREVEAGDSASDELEPMQHCADMLVCDSLDQAILSYSRHTAITMDSCSLYHDEWALSDRRIAAKETEGCGIHTKTCSEGLLSFVSSVLGMNHEAWALRTPADLRRIAAILASCVGTCSQKVAGAQKQCQQHKETAVNRTKSLGNSDLKTSFVEWRKSFHRRYSVRIESFARDARNASRALEGLEKGRDMRLGGWGSGERVAWTKRIVDILNTVKGICVLADEIHTLTKFFGCVLEGGCVAGVSWAQLVNENPHGSYESMLNRCRCAVLGQEMSHWLALNILDHTMTPQEERKGATSFDGASGSSLKEADDPVADKMIDKLRMDVHRLRRENEELEAKLEEARADASVAEIRLEDARREVVSVMKDLATLEADKQSVEGELHAMRVKDYHRKAKYKAFFRWQMSVQVAHLATRIHMERMEVMRKGLKAESLRDSLVSRAVRGGAARSVVSAFYRWRGNSGKSKAANVLRIIQVDAWRRINLSKFLSHWRRRADVRRVDQLMISRHTFKSMACSFYVWKSFHDKAVTRSFARRCDRFSQSVAKSYWIRVDLLAGWEAFRWNRDVSFAVSRVTVHTKSHAFRQWKELNVSAHNVITTVKRVIRRLRHVGLVRGLAAFRRSVIASEVRDRYQVAMHLRRVFAKWKILAACRSKDLRLLCKATTRWVASSYARAWNEWRRTTICRRRLKSVGKSVLFRWHLSTLTKALMQWDYVVQMKARLRFAGRHFVRRAEARVLRHWVLVSQGGSGMVVYRSTLMYRCLQRRRHRRAILQWRAYVHRKKRRLEKAHLKANVAGYLVPQQAAFKMWTEFVANLRRRTRIMDGVLRLERRTLHKWIPRKRMPYFQHWVDVVRQRKDGVCYTGDDRDSPEISSVKDRVLSGVHGSVHGEPVSSNDSAKMLLATTDIEKLPPPVNAPQLYETAL